MSSLSVYSILTRLAHEGLQKIKQVLDEVLAKIRNSDCIIRIAIICQHFMTFMMDKNIVTRKQFCICVLFPNAKLKASIMYFVFLGKL